MTFDPWKTCTPEQRERIITAPLRFPEFSGEDTACRKCGTHRVDTIHRPAQLPWTHVDWLLRSCCCCGFKWNERCVNPTRIELDPDYEEIAR